MFLYTILFPVISNDEVPEGFEILLLSTFASVVNITFSEAKEGHFLSNKEMANNPFSFKISSNDLRSQELPRNIKKLQNQSLLISRIGGNLRPTYVLADEKNPVFFSP